MSRLELGPNETDKKIDEFQCARDRAVKTGRGQVSFVACVCISYVGRRYPMYRKRRGQREVSKARLLK